jgi:hypothetical protein
MTISPLPAWLPDQPAHMNPGLVTCENVIPRTDKSYGPFSGLSVYSNALGSLRCQGAFTGRDSSGNITIFAGTQTKLQSLTSGALTFTDVTRTSGGAYATGSDEMWRFAQYGSRVVATNFADDVQSFLFGSSSAFALLSADAPKAKYVAIWKDFLVLGHLSSFPQTVRWSAIDDPTSWPTLATSAAAQVQSDQQVLAGDGGHIQGVVGGLGNADGVVFQERAIWRVTYVGPPLIFTFDLVEGARGCVAPGSIVQLGGVVLYLGEDGWYLFDGVQSKPVGAGKVDKTFFRDFDQTYVSRMSASVDPINKIFYVAYPGAGNTGGDCNRLLAYNWSLDRWSRISVNSEYIFRAGTFGYTADSADGLGYTVDTSPFGPDSRFWAGGRSILAGFDRDHKLGFFSGSNLAAEFETGDLDLGDGKRAFISGIRPFVDGVSTVTSSVGYRNTLNEAVSYTTPTSAAADGFCPQRISTRFARAKISIAAGGEWDHASGYEPRFRPEGMR